jgi:phosphoribosylamine--glycine ligase/phosphoribosylformylglycinamidine cyclo-ligase
VLKASGLAGGKGVLIPANVDEAVKGLQEIMVDKAFGSAGQFLLLLTKVPTDLMLCIYR